MDICVCKQKQPNAPVKLYVAITTVLYIALAVFVFVSSGSDAILTTLMYVALLAVIVVGVALWRMRNGHSFGCALLWAYVSPVTEVVKVMRQLG